MAKQTFTTGQVLSAAQMTSLQQTAMGGGSTTAKIASYVLVAADAGTVVQMNSASATTITVNTALFAAGDSVQIQNIGAGVCTVTAGTATVSTSATLALKQYDSGDLYFNTTSAAFFFSTDAADSTSPLTTKGDLYGFSTLDARIPIGTNNQVLTADSAQALGLKWATPATATKNWTLVNSGGTSLSGTSTQISGLSSYDDLLIVIAGASYTAAGVNLAFTFNSVVTANSYTRYGARISALSTYAAANFLTWNSATGVNIATVAMSTNASSTISGGLQVSGCKGSGVKQFTAAFGATAAGGTDNEETMYMGVANATTVISTIEVTSTSAATFDAGTVFVYGA